MKIGKILLGAVTVMAAPISTPAFIAATAATALAGMKEVSESSVVAHVFKEHARPKPGSIVQCRLAFQVEHSGVYIGDGFYAELHGSGEIRRVTHEQFLRGMDEGIPVRTGLSVYVACDGVNPLGNRIIADRATAMVGKTRSYNLILDNCHQFTSGCITGDFENANNFFWMLESLIEEELNLGDSINWRVVD